MKNEWFRNRLTKVAYILVSWESQNLNLMYLVLYVIGQGYSRLKVKISY